MDAKAFFFGRGVFGRVIRAGLWFFAFIFLCLFLFFLWFDINDWKPEIEKAASSLLREKVGIAGKVELGISSTRPSIVLHDVTAGDVRARRLEIVVPFKDAGSSGRLRLYAQAEGLAIGEAGEARLEGAFGYQGADMTAVGRLENIEYARFAEGVEGKADAVFDLQAQGDDREKILSTLAGKIEISGGKGRMAGKGIDLWAVDLFSLMLPEGNDETVINCLKADFDIRDGVATARKLVMDTDKIVVTGTGALNLVTGTVGIRLTPKPKNLTLASIATPVLVTGGFDDLRIEPDPQAVMHRLGGVALGILNPLAALAPLIGGGGRGDSCK